MSQAGGWKTVRIRAERHAEVAATAERQKRSVADVLDELIATSYAPREERVVVKAASPDVDVATIAAVARAGARRKCPDHPESGAVEVGSMLFCEVAGCPRVLKA